MRKSISKYFKLLIGFVTMLTAFGINPIPVSAEGDGVLTGAYSFERYFTEDTISALTGGSALAPATMKTVKGEMLSNLFSIEPGAKAEIGQNYTNTYEKASAEAYKQSVRRCRSLSVYS